MFIVLFALSQRQCDNRISSKLVRRKKDVYVAPHGKRLLTFVDDINMPSADEFGSQHCLEYLRQLIECKGCYESQGLTWKRMQVWSIVENGLELNGRYKRRTYLDENDVGIKPFLMVSLSFDQ